MLTIVGYVLVGVLSLASTWMAHDAHRMHHERYEPEDIESASPQDGCSHDEGFEDEGHYI